jgi:ceramide glucosyltransferase
MGQRLAGHGYRVVLADTVVETIVDEPDLATLFRHELRWNRAVRACRPNDHLLSLVMQSLPLSAILLLAAGPFPLAAGVIATHVILRLMLHGVVRRQMAISGPSRAWLVPVRECMCFAVWLAAYFTRHVQWGQMKMQVDRDLSMSMLDERQP